MQLSYNLLQLKLQENAPRPCSDYRCGRWVAPGGTCYLDVQNNALYCEACGPMVRFIRKKADQRGEDWQGLDGEDIDNNQPQAEAV